MEEQIFSGDTGFNKLTFARSWLIQGRLLNVFDYQGRPLFLLTEVAGIVFPTCPVNKMGLYDLVFGCRVKLSDVEAAKKAHGKLSRLAWFITEEGVNRIIDYKTKTRKKSLVASSELKRLLRTLHPWITKIEKTVPPQQEPVPPQQEPVPSQCEEPEEPQEEKVVNLPTMSTQEHAVHMYQLAMSEVHNLREAICKLSISERGTEVLLEEFEEALATRERRKATVDAFGLKVTAAAR